MKRALLLVNTGSPENTSRKSVCKYLRAFLNDSRVIDIPAIFRFLLVNLIIIPFRAGKSSRLYKKIWTEEGSPLVINMERLIDKLNKKFMGNLNARSYGAMRYGRPSLKEALALIREDNPVEIVFIPLFPQYATSTSASATHLFLQTTGNLDIKPRIRLISSFHDHPAFINAFSDRILSYHPDDFDYVLFSYHGLPLRHLKKLSTDRSCEKCEGQDKNCSRYCYKAACYETTRLIAEKCKIPRGKYSTGFQSRMGKGWTGPFTDKMIKDYAEGGIRKLLVTAPSFVSDCLETLSEIEREGREIFLSHGGRKFVLVKSLNFSDSWAKALTEIAGLTGSEAPV
jgi:protoporphyrin/coproporphyrin ferrochelatase